MSPAFGRRHPRGNLSAYVDGALPASQKANLEAHLSGCGACRSDVAELRALRSALGALPAQAVPRSFTLRAEQVAEPRPSAARPAAGLAGGLRLASAGLAMALAVLIVIDAQTGDDSSGSGGVATDNYTRSEGDDAAQVAGPEEQASTATPPLDTDSAGGVGGPAATEGTDDGGGTSDGGGTAGGGVGGAGGDTQASAVPTSVPSPTPAPSITAPLTESPGESTSIPDAYDGAEGADNGPAGSTAGEDDGFDALLFFEVVLGIAALAAFGGSIYVMRASRSRTP